MAEHKDLDQPLCENSLSRFHQAQKFAYPLALREIRAGRKKSHWIWYIFPQLRGIGHSPNSNFYGIADAAEAKAYLADAVLSARLAEITEAVLALPQSDPVTVFGELDAQKLCSSMTLFAAVAPDPTLFAAVLDRCFGGKRDALTLHMLGLTEE